MTHADMEAVLALADHCQTRSEPLILVPSDRYPGVAWVYARGRDLADPFPQTLENGTGQNIGMVFPYAPGDTVLWEVDGSTGGRGRFST